MGFIYANLEYIVACVGVVGVVFYMKTRKIGNNSNDLTPYVVKLNKQHKAITERTKGVL